MFAHAVVRCDDLSRRRAGSSSALRYDGSRNPLKIQLECDQEVGRLDGSSYTQMSEQWRTEREIARHQAADRSYLEEGAQLIELAHGAQRLFAKQEAQEQRRLLNFVLSNSIWKDRELTATFRQPFNLIAEATAAASGGEGGGEPTFAGATGLAGEPGGEAARLCR
jgi:hypothetical protein